MNACELRVQNEIAHRNRMSLNVLALCASLACTPTITAQPGTHTIKPDSARFSEVINGTTQLVDYRGRRAIKLNRTADVVGTNASIFAILADNDFKDGTISIDVAGTPRADAAPDSRGFIGIAFRTGEHAKWSEIFYLRPTNGRADDQLRRNHTVQYVSEPEYPWPRLREEHPGEYESYTDVEAAAWTNVRIVVSGTTAKLYVNGAAQPCLIVNDLKHGDIEGRIALWAHNETEAYFGALSVMRR